MSSSSSVATTSAGARSTNRSEHNVSEDLVSFRLAQCPGGRRAGLLLPG